MTHKAVENMIKFTWTFIPEIYIKVFELEENIMVFKFPDWDTLRKVFEERPWRIDGNLVILHDYNPLALIHEMEWETQEFWIQLKHLLPEHMNVRVFEAIGKLV